MVNEGVHLSLEVRRWFNLWNNKCYQKKQKTDTTQTSVDGKSVYVVESPPDSFVDVLKVADIVFFPNIKKLLLIGATSPRSSSEVEREASGIRRLKTTFRIYGKKRRTGKQFKFQIRTANSINVEEILQKFIKKNPRK